MSVAAPAAPPASGADAVRLRMKDLCEATGLTRQAIHFYVREGLMPPGEKTSRNMAWYTPAHLERIRLIKRLQHERFLPLDAIKALLDEREERFDDRQRAFLRQVRARLRMDEVPADDSVDGAELVARGPARAEDLEALADAGTPGIGRDAGGRVRVRGEAVPVVEVLGRLRALGFTDAAGFRATDILVYHQAVADLLRQEATLIAGPLATLPPDQAAEQVAQALPLVHELLTHLHRVRIEEFLDGI
ncbi:MAG: MerR family transcriptional regulator [Alphaproteobacteria bacterium]|nr:MerR family transcriptional regulator [Alphaproteobacteria bacterium]